MKIQSLLPLVLITLGLTAKSFTRRLNMERVVSKIYHVEGTQVLLTYQGFLPKDKEALRNKAVIFIPGWAWRADSKSIEGLCEELAYNSEAETFVICTRNEQVTPDSLDQEAKAVCKFLAENELKEITLVGYSQGGIKAINTLIHLQEMHSSMHIEGLILIDSVGLNEVDSHELAKRFIVDLLIKSPLMIMRELERKPGIRKKLLSFIENVPLATSVCFELIQCILKEVRTSNLSYFSRVQNELREMAKINPYLERIRVPIVLIQGLKDRVSDCERIITQTREKSAQTLSQDSGRGILLGPKKNINKRILAENVFPQSPYVRMIEAEKFGTHGLPLFRSKSVARVSLYLLQRAGRDLNHAVGKALCALHTPATLIDAGLLRHKSD
jgi:pimeloyl-ACP methyl ester carboxylesterase